MFNRYLTYYPAAIQFVLLCGISSMCLILGQYASGVVFEKVAGIPLTSILSLNEISPQLAYQIKLLQPFTQVLCLLLPAWLFAYFAYPVPLQYLGAGKKINFQFLVIAVLLFAAALPFSSLLEELSRLVPMLNPKEPDIQDKLYTAMLKGGKVSDLLFNTVVICLIPAIAEEFFFRACLQQVLLNWMRKYPFTAMMLVAVAFSAFHGQLSGFLPRVYLGYVLCLVYYFTGNIWYSVLIHFLNNFLIVFVAFWSERGLLPFDYLEQSHLHWTIGVASLAGTLALIYYFYKKRIVFVPVEIEKDRETEEDGWPGKPL